jgi:indole-3-glycerol phosphate synthase
LNSRLDDILATTRRTVAERKTASDLQSLQRAAEAHQPRGFAQALRRRAASAPAIIAELKKASPSRGLIRQNFDVASLAQGFAAAGAAVLSVVTEEQFFQGSLRNLEIASESSGLPCLRKDFIVDGFQILEARAHRGDAILLIAAALTDAELRQLAAQAHALELDILCEVHTAEELDRVLDLGLDCQAIGVNNRNLKTFEVRLEVSLGIASRLPQNVLHVAESGIDSAEHINLLRGAGYDAFLIGESLMRQPDPGAALAQLLQSFAALEELSPASAGGSATVGA